MSGVKPIEDARWSDSVRMVATSYTTTPGEKAEGSLRKLKARSTSRITNVLAETAKSIIKLMSCDATPGCPQQEESYPPVLHRDLSSLLHPSLEECARATVLPNVLSSILFTDGYDVSTDVKRMFLGTDDEIVDLDCNGLEDSDAYQRRLYRFGFGLRRVKKIGMITYDNGNQRNLYGNDVVIQMGHTLIPDGADKDSMATCASFYGRDDEQRLFACFLKEKTSSGDDVQLWCHGVPLHILHIHMRPVQKHECATPGFCHLTQRDNAMYLLRPFTTKTAELDSAVGVFLFFIHLVHSKGDFSTFLKNLPPELQGKAEDVTRTLPHRVNQWIQGRVAGVQVPDAAVVGVAVEAAYGKYKVAWDETLSIAQVAKNFIETGCDYDLITKLTTPKKGPKTDCAMFSFWSMINTARWFDDDYPESDHIEMKQTAMQRFPMDMIDRSNFMPRGSTIPVRVQNVTARIFDEDVHVQPGTVAQAQMYFSGAIETRMMPRDPHHVVPLVTDYLKDTGRNATTRALKHATPEFHLTVLTSQCFVTDEMALNALAFFYVARQWCDDSFGPSTARAPEKGRPYAYLCGLDDQQALQAEAPGMIAVKDVVKRAE